MRSRRCRSCHEDLPLTAFAWKRENGRFTKRHVACRKCRRAAESRRFMVKYAPKWRAAHDERIQTEDARREKAWRVRLIQIRNHKEWREPAEFDRLEARA